MEKYIEGSKKSRELEKKERADISNFMEMEEVKSVFSRYERQLHQMFKFFAAQDTKKDSSTFDNEYLYNTLSYRELIRFGYQQ